MVRGKKRGKCKEANGKAKQQKSTRPRIDKAHASQEALVGFVFGGGEGVWIGRYGGVRKVGDALQELCMEGLSLL